MNRRWTAPAMMGAIAVLMGAALSIPAQAQFRGGPPGGGGPGMFRGGPPPGGGPMGRQVSGANVPVHTLAMELNLTDTQKSRIQLIQDNVRKQRRSMFGGGRPDPRQFGSMFQKMRALDSAASKQIEAVLTSSQNRSMKPLLASLNAAQGVGIPLEIYSDLKLTSAQKKEIAKLSASNRNSMQAAFSQGQSGGFDAVRTAMESMRTKTDAKLKALLTAKQYALLTDYKKKHPRRGFGGPGGPGGGPGMPPPPGAFGGPGPGGGRGFGGNGGWPQGDQSANSAGPDDNMGPPPGEDMGPPPAGDDMPPPPGGFED